MASLGLSLRFRGTVSVTFAEAFVKGRQLVAWNIGRMYFDNLRGLQRNGDPYWEC